MGKDILCPVGFEFLQSIFELGLFHLFFPLFKELFFDFSGLNLGLEIFLLPSNSILARFFYLREDLIF